MVRQFCLFAIPLSLVAFPAAAQMVDVPIWSNGLLGQQALRNTYDNADRANKTTTDRRAASTRECSPDALPAADRRRMEAEYIRRARADGKASADIWVREQGQVFREKLVAQGICPPLAGKARTAANDGGKKTRKVRDRNGRVCTKTRLANRVVPNVSGGPMTMALVPVCAD